MDCVGSDKRYCFCINGSSSRLYTFESAIDCISHATLENRIQGNAEPYRADSRLSLGGTSGIALAHYLQRYNHITELVFCLDNDDAGRKRAIRLAREYADKDYFTRLGRNYIESGSYIEIFFPRHGVRYIAISNNVDSLNKQEMNITPFRNILNDMFSRDISKKVLAGRMALSRQGKFCGGPAPYGLMRDPKDNGHLIIDPETAPTVKLIFDLALDGCGTMKIAKQLLKRKIPIKRCKTAKIDINYYSWGGSVISKMLRNPLYYGAHVVCKTHQKAIRSNTCKFVPRNEWEVIEDCHEPIITIEHFE